MLSGKPSAAGTPPGWAENAIARETKIHRRKVSAIVAELALSFKRSPRVQAATQAKVIDAKARRLKIDATVLEEQTAPSQMLNPAGSSLGQQGVVGAARVSGPAGHPRWA